MRKWLSRAGWVDASSPLILNANFTRAREQNGKTTESQDSLSRGAGIRGVPPPVSCDQLVTISPTTLPVYNRSLIPELYSTSAAIAQLQTYFSMPFPVIRDTCARYLRLHYTSSHPVMSDSYFSRLNFSFYKNLCCIDFASNFGSFPSGN